MSDNINYINFLKMNYDARFFVTAVIENDDESGLLSLTK